MDRTQHDSTALEVYDRMSQLQSWIDTSAVAGNASQLKTSGNAFHALILS